MTNEKIISAERFSAERQLKQILPEMEEERVTVRQAILDMPSADTTGVAILSRIYGAYMGEFVNFVRRYRGGLQPYSFQYEIADGEASPSDPHQLFFCHRDVGTKDDVIIAQFAVVHLPNDETYPLHGDLTQEDSDEISAGIHQLNEAYADHVDEQDLASTSCASLFYLPFLAAMGSLVKSATDGPSCHETVVDPPMPLATESLFIPYDFYFDNENPDPEKQFMSMRVGQRSSAGTVLAVEAVFRLGGLRVAAIAERKYSDLTTTSAALH